MTIEKKGGNTISANEADKRIRKLVDDNPVMTKSKNILNEIDRLKKEMVEIQRKAYSLGTL